MTTLPAPLVDIHTSPNDVPSMPSWFAELILLARHFTQRGILAAVAEHVRLARGRAGHYDVIDFVAVLLGYAISGEPTVEAFFDLYWLVYYEGMYGFPSSRLFQAFADQERLCAANIRLARF
jgi:hypothetical protein